MPFDKVKLKRQNQKHFVRFKLVGVSTSMADLLDLSGKSDLSVGSANVAGPESVHAPEKADHYLLFSEYWLDNYGMRAFMPDDFEPDTDMTLTRLAKNPSLYLELPKRLAMQPSVIDCAIKSEAESGGTDVIRLVIERLLQNHDYTADYTAAKSWIVRAVAYGNFNAIEHSFLLMRGHNDAAMHATIAEALAVNGRAIIPLHLRYWNVPTQAKHVLLAMKTYPGAVQHVKPEVRKLVDANRELLEKHFDELVQLLLQAHQKV
jgi:hypothetical protein